MNIHPAVCTYSEVPPFLRKNKYIRHGYRLNFTTSDCIVRSLLTVSNETLNIWLCLLAGLAFMYQVKVTNSSVLPWYKYTTSIDYFLMSLQCLCFAMQCFLCAAYHALCCRSELYSEMLIHVKSMGSTMGLFGAYMTTFYYAFDCFSYYRWFYIICFVFVLLGHHFLLLHLTYESKGKGNAVMVVTYSPYLCGMVPLLHWMYACGGFDYPAVFVLAPKIMYMYMGGGVLVALHYYKLPERWLPGRLDYFFTSYQFGNILMVVLMVTWHNVCLYLIDFSLSGTLVCPFSDDLYGRNYAKQVGSGSNLFFDNSGTQ